MLRPGSEPVESRRICVYGAAVQELLINDRWATLSRAILAAR